MAVLRIAAWLIVAIFLVFPFVFPKEGALALFPLWAALSILLVGKSVVIRIGKGLLAALVVLTGIFVIQYFLPNRADYEPEATSASEVSLTTLLEDYSSGGNEVAADRKYKGRLIRTTGVAKEIRKDVLDRAYVIVGTDMGLHVPDLQCTLAEAAAAEAASARSGTEISVQGRVAGLLLNVQAEDCVFVRTARSSSETPAVSVVTESTADADRAAANVRPPSEVSAGTAPVESQKEQSAAIVDATPQPTEIAATQPTPTVEAPSFDCAKASTVIEKTICADAQLGTLDAQVSRAYKEMLKRPTFDAAEVKGEQRQWLKDREGCSDAACLTDMYKKRLADLKDGLDRS